MHFSFQVMAPRDFQLIKTHFYTEFYFNTHIEAFRMYLTFPVNDCEVRVGGAYSEDKLVSNEGFVRVNGTYCLNQL